MPVPTTTFKLPITFVEKNKLHKLDEHILTDLELTNCNNINDDANDANHANDANDSNGDAKPKTMYEHILNPKTIYGKQFLENWATYYTSDVIFLKQTQTLLKKFSSNTFPPKFSITRHFPAYTPHHSHNSFFSSQNSKNTRLLFFLRILAQTNRAIPSNWKSI